MQSLWSRAAQAHVCSCRVCSRIIPGTAIRRTVTALNRRRKPTFSEVFTAFYTTIFGTAAVLDAHYKDGRRKELDAKIDDARRKVDQLRQSSSLAGHGEQKQIVREADVHDWAWPEEDAGLMTQRVPLNAIEALNSICKMDDVMGRHKRSHHRLLHFLRSLHKTYDPDNRLGNDYIDFSGVHLKSIHFAVMSEMESGTAFVREPMTALQFERYHEMINKMVEKLIAQSYHDEFPRDPEKAQRNLDSLDSTWTMIRMLRSEGYPRYNHPSIDHEATKKGRKELADIICQLFDLWSEDDRKNKPKLQIAKICYNLLICPVPPSIHHFNLLMIGFMMKSAPNLVEIVVETILTESRLRPTPQTIVCLLVHYRRTRDIQSFYNVIRRMVAIDNRGLLQRRRGYDEVLKIPVLREWATTTEITTSLNSKWVIQQAPRNADIYEVLVSGLLSFGRIKDAAKVFVASLQERMGISVGLLVQLLRQCLYCLDAAAARILRQGLLDNIDITVSLLLRPSCPRGLVDHLYPVFTLDRAPARPFSEKRAGMAWHTRTVAMSPSDNGTTRLLNVALFIRHAESQVERLGKITARLMRMLRTTNLKDLSLLAVARIHELDAFDGRNRFLAKRVLKHQALHRTARMLENSTWDLRPGTLASVHGYAVHVLENNLPRPAQDGGYGEREVYEEKLAEIHGMVDHWFQYRITRLRGVGRLERQLMLQAELALFQGNRLGRYILSILPAEIKWRKLSLEDDIKWVDLSLSKSVDEAELAAAAENVSEEDSVWPKAEAGALFMRGPVVRAV